MGYVRLRHHSETQGLPERIERAVHAQCLSATESMRYSGSQTLENGETINLHFTSTLFLHQVQLHVIIIGNFIFWGLLVCSFATSFATSSGTPSKILFANSFGTSFATS